LTWLSPCRSQSLCLAFRLGVKSSSFTVRLSIWLRLASAKCPSWELMRAEPALAGTSSCRVSIHSQTCCTHTHTRCCCCHSVVDPRLTACCSVGRALDGFDRRLVAGGNSAGVVGLPRLRLPSNLLSHRTRRYDRALYKLGGVLVALCVTAV
jgi:hypothetical protein